MIEYDFLRPFEEEIELNADVDHRLEGEEREIFKAMMEQMENRQAEYRRRVTIIKNPEKRKQFEELYPSLIHLAKENCACLRIFDEDEANDLIRVELEFLNILGGHGEDAIHGAVLAKIFDNYRDFSLELTLQNRMILKFNVPLVDEIFVSSILDVD